jgi:hypothetical protein
MFETFYEMLLFVRFVSLHWFANGRNVLDLLVNLQNRFFGYLEHPLEYFFVL